MVDIWLLFCIGMIFAIIIFLSVIDNYLPEKGLDKYGHIQPSLVRVAPKMMLDVDNESILEKQEKFARRLIRASKIVSLGLFIIFNTFYWAFILT